MTSVCQEMSASASISKPYELKMCEDAKEKQKFKLVITDVFPEGVQATTWQSETCAGSNFLGSEERSIDSLTHIHREDIHFPCTIQA